MYELHDNIFLHNMIFLEYQSIITWRTHLTSSSVFLATVLSVSVSPPVASVSLLLVRVAGGVATVVAGVSRGVSQAVRSRIVKVTCARDA